MMNKNTYAKAYAIVLAIVFSILIANLSFGFWPQLRGALFLALSILLAAGFYIVGLWMMSNRIDDLRRKLPVNGAERRRKNKEFYDWLRPQGRR